MYPSTDHTEYLKMLNLRDVFRCRNSNNHDCDSFECFRVPDKFAFECPNCGRQYSALVAWQYREEVANDRS